MRLIDALRCCGHNMIFHYCDNLSCPYCKYSCSDNLHRCDTQALGRDAADAIERLQAQVPAWISVEERLPEESGEYTVYIQMGTGVEVPDFLGSNDLSYVTSVYFKKDKKLWLDEYDESYNADLSLVDTANDYHVTHWMELPEPPNCGAKMKGANDERD